MRLTPRRILLLGLVAIAATQAAPSSVRADTTSDLEAARARVASAQAEANAIAAELSRAEGKSAEIQRAIEAIEASIAKARAQAAALEGIVRERAVSAYVESGTTVLEFESLLSTSRPMDLARRTQFLDRANRQDNQAIDDLAALRADLAERQVALKREHDAQQVVHERLAEQRAAITATLAEADRARDALAARLDQEQAAAAAEEAARIRALQAASRVPAPSSGNPSAGGGTTAGSTGGAPSGAGQVIANPGGGSFQCPVAGSGYNDNYGSRGSGFHWGIDMFASSGVPLVAVKAGKIWHMPMNGAGGNEAYLDADDGNTYFYAHLSAYAGGPRSVVQGEVIGYVGATGNAVGAHLHFEIRVGGPNGQRIDPFPTLQSAGC